jgi:hypothetical protein
MAEKAPRTVVKEVTNGRLYSDGSILIKELRLSYPHALIPKAGTDDDGKPTAPSFSVVGLAPKKTHGAVRKLLSDEIDKILAHHKVDRLANDRKFLRNGDDAAKDGYDGMWTISCRETIAHPPAVRGPDKSLWGIDKAPLIFGGCYGNLLIRPWWQSHVKYGKRVNANFLALQFLRKGEPFGEGVISQQAIDDSFDHEATDEEEMSHANTSDFDVDDL